MRELNLNSKSISEIIAEYPFAEGFFDMNRIIIEGKEELTLAEILDEFSEEEIEDNAFEVETIEKELEEYINQMLEFLGVDENKVNKLTIISGTNKKGEPEGFEKLEIFPSEIISIVGPTGSGKSRLLADIEWAAKGDTPTGRSILINDAEPDPKWRYSPTRKLVSQLSQNMNFVMDISAGEFVKLHAESRMIANPDDISAQILEAANKLAGEPFLEDTPLTSLSGGQSRALMIADTAILSSSPIVLIDEIENAGIDRKKALNLLVAQDKIVLMATHDPLLSLMANRRIVIKNGGILKVIDTSQKEKETLEKLGELDTIFQDARAKIRAGEHLENLI